MIADLIKADLVEVEATLKPLITYKVSSRQKIRDIAHIQFQKS